MIDSLAVLGRMVIERGLLSEEALAGALVDGAMSETRFLSRLLTEHGLREADLVAVLAERHGQPGVELSTSAFLLDVLDLIPRPVAEGDQILPLSTEGGRLHVAVTSPDAAQGSTDEVRFITGMEVSVYVALGGPLETAISSAYNARARGESVWRGPALPANAPLGLTILQPTGSHPGALAGLGTAATDVAEPATTPAAGEEEHEIVLELDAPLEPAAAAASPPGSAPPPPARPAEDDSPFTFEPLAADLGGQPPRRPSSGIELEIVGAEEDEEEEQEPAVLSLRLGPKRVLVVDDEPDIVKLCTRSLQVKGYLVDSAADGAEAERKLFGKGGEPPDLVLLDAMLPQVHGFEICQRIKAHKALRGVQVIMMSAVYRGWRFAQDARETYGADDYVEKPFHLADLLERVEERLEQGATRKPAPQKKEAERLYKSGMEALDQGKVPEARTALEAAVREDPFSPRAHFALARALSTQGDVYRAISAYERAVELRPSLFPALKNLANLYLEKGFRRKAAETLERALQVAPDPMTREMIKAQLLRLL